MSTSSLPRSAPEAQGVPSAAVRALVDTIEGAALELHSFILVRHGHVVAEGWWEPYAATLPHMLFSLSKSFTSTAAGLAIGEGRFSLDDTVIGFFPEQLPEDISDNLAAMRVRDLLAMGTGHDEDTLGRVFRQEAGDWVKAFLEAPVPHPPGTHFVYNSGATYMVSAIVQKVTGQRLLDYLRPRLFEPLGIQNPTWEQCPKGIDTGGWGLSIKTDDIAKFGQLYLQDGMWEGRRLLPEGWVADASAKHIANGDDPGNDWNQGYGFQFWRCRHNVYRGDGAFGQYCLVMPDQDAVLAITSGVGDMQAVLNVVWDTLLPALASAPLPADPDAEGKLRARLDALRLPLPAGANTLSHARLLDGRTFVFGPNDRGLESAMVTLDSAGGKLTLTEKGHAHAIAFGLGSWVAAPTTWTLDGLSVSGLRTDAAAAGARWRDDGTLAIRLAWIETPFIALLELAPSHDGRLRIAFRPNVSFGSLAPVVLEGEAQK